MAIKTLLIEDDKSLAGLIKRSLEENGIFTTHFSEGYKALDSLKARNYDAVILDIVLPDTDGFQVCRKIREHDSKIPILFLTARDQTHDKVKGLDLGANDYLTKPFDISELLARVRVQTRPKDTSYENNALRYAGIELDLNRHQVVRNGKTIALTPKEFSLLEFFMRAPGKLHTRYVIEEKVWDRNVEISSNVVDVYVNHLRRKINIGNLPNLIHAVRASGYIFELREEKRH
ncbi:MAG: response regulator transcription factor [bacterium]